MYFVSEFANGPVSFARLLIDAGILVAECSRPEQVLSAEARVKRLPDLTSLENAEKVAEEMARCLGEPQII